MVVPSPPPLLQPTPVSNAVKNPSTMPRRAVVAVSAIVECYPRFAGATTLAYLLAGRPVAKSR